MEDNNKLSEALASLIRFGYNDAIIEIADYVEWYIRTTQGQNHVDVGPLKEKLALMTEKKKTINFDALKIEMGL